jgi:hypothetical protein
VENIPRFIEFLDSIGQTKKLTQPGSAKPTIAPESDVDKSNPLYNKKIVMTKVRDQDIIRELKARGAGLGDNIDKNTFVLIVKSLEDVSNKTKYAVEHNIPIMIPEDFKAKYFV